MGVIIKERSTTEINTYYHYFENSINGTAYSFDCKKDGSLIKLQDSKNYIDMLHNRNLAYRGIQTRRMVTTEYAELKCTCGDIVILQHFTNTCACDKDYNSLGQELAPRSQWGCETGEHWTDCY